MPQVWQIQSNLNAGELSPRVMGRIDLEKYFNGCSTLENYINMPWGGVTRRPGTKYIASVKTPAKFTRLIPFEYSADQAYMLEFGHQYIRFFYNGAAIYVATDLVTNGNFTEGISGWTTYGAVVWDAPGQRMEIAGASSYAGQALTTVAVTTYVLSFLCTYFTRVKIGTTLHGTEISNQLYSPGTVSIPFTSVGTTTYIEFSTEQVGPAPRNPWYYLHTTIDEVACVSAAIPLEVVSPYTEGELADIQFAQSADVLFLTHPNHMPQKLMRFGHTDWVLKALNTMPPPTSEQQEDISGGTISISPAAVTGNGITVLASASAFQNGDCYRLLKYRDGLAVVRTFVSATEVTVDFIYDFPSTVAPAAGPGTVTTVTTALTCSQNHGLSAGDWVRLTSGAQSGEKRRVVATPTGTTATLASAFSVDQSAGVNWSKDKEIAAAAWTLLGAPGSTCTPSAVGVEGGSVDLTLSVNANGWRSNDVGKYVRGNSGLALITVFTSATVVTARVLVPFASTTAILAGAWTLESGEWSATNGYPKAICFFEQRLYFGGTTAKPTTFWGSRSADYENFQRGSSDADSVVYTIASNTMNHIEWMASTKALLLGTAGGELRAIGSTESPITPSNIDLKSEATFGSAGVMPVRVGNAIVFVQRAQKKLRDLYSIAQEDYSIGVSSSDLTLLADHIAQERITALDFAQEPYSQVWCVRGDGVLLAMTYVKGEKVVGWTRHELGGGGIVESVATIPAPEGGSDEVWLVVRRTINGSTARYIEKMSASVFTDSCILYSGAATTTISGLSHLEGQVVKVVADGNEADNATVSGGAITLAVAASTVEVGLGFTPQLVTVRPEIAALGTIQGRKKRWVEVWVRILETRGLVINGKPQENDEEETGDLRVPNLGFDRDGKITITQPHPYPSTILSIFGKLGMGD